MSWPDNQELEMVRQHGTDKDYIACLEWHLSRSVDALRDLLAGCGRSEETDETVEKARAFLLKHRSGGMNEGD